MVTSGALDNVKQIAIEIHFSKQRYGQQETWGQVPAYKQLSQLRQLYEAGFRIVMRERNLYSAHTWVSYKHEITTVNEITLIHQ